MQNTIVHNEGAASLKVAGTKVGSSPALIKIGLDVHAYLYVAVVQYDHLLPKPARRFLPREFLPWVEGLRRCGHTVQVVYEACGFGFGLYRALQHIGVHCYVIAPRKLDEQHTGVKTDPRDAATLCQRLSRYIEGNTRELAVIRVPTERRGTGSPCLAPARATGPSSPKAPGAGTCSVGESQFAFAGSLVEAANLEPIKQAPSGMGNYSSGVLPADPDHAAAPNRRPPALS